VREQKVVNQSQQIDFFVAGNGRRNRAEEAAELMNNADIVIVKNQG